MINVSNLVGGVVNIAPSPSHPVEVLSWDITLGAAGSGLGQLILEKMSSSPDMVPEAVDHVGIIVYGYLYEYGDLGILKTPAPLQSNPESKYPVFSLRNRERVGETERNQEEFEAWVDLMNKTDFPGSGYNVVSKSCVIWAMTACQFLGVTYPANWDKLCNWATENSTVANLVGGSGVQSRKMQIKAQTTQAPKKLASYLKKKLKIGKKSHTPKGDGDEKAVHEAVQGDETETSSSTSSGSSTDSNEEDNDDDDDDKSQDKVSSEVPQSGADPINRKLSLPQPTPT